MIKIVVLTTFLLSVAFAELPLPQNSYLPPGQGQNSAPSNSYGPPNQQSRSFSSAPSNSYGPPAQQSRRFNTAPSNSYGPPTQQSRSFSSAPSNSYGPPAQQSRNFIAAPSSSYNSQNVQSFNNFDQQKDNSYFAASSSNNEGYSYNNNNNNNNVNEEPAKYEFQYDVQDAPSGNDFGHKESRDGSVATGKYYVLLPDGRKQIVNYIADENGYRPTITYEETNQGYNNNAQQGGFNGY
ncbi:unnamed protein product [Diamesa hyperborea]